ncbi:MAG: hypothetical protein H6560_15285 [Lewinellaceae bacterium]|nr:hypothetical protein [Lewinellaceae bacterium]
MKQTPNPVKPLRRGGSTPFFRHKEHNSLFAEKPASPFFQSRKSARPAMATGQPVIQREVIIGGEPKDEKAVLAKAKSDTKDPAFVEWLERSGWAKKETAKHDKASWEAFWEEAYLAYLAEKGIEPEASVGGDAEKMHSRFKDFRKEKESGKLLATAKELKNSWQLLKEMAAYEAIKNVFKLPIPQPELVRLPGEGEAPGPLAIRMDHLTGEFIDLFKDTSTLILGRIAKVVLQHKDIAKQKEVIGNFVAWFKQAAEISGRTKMIIWDLQGILDANGNFTIIDPLDVVSYEKLGAGEQGKLAQTGRTQQEVYNKLLLAMNKPAGLSEYLKFAAGPSGD